MVPEIGKSLEIKEHVLVAFLDIEGAFNNIQPKAILSALKDLDISEPLQKLVKQILLARSTISMLVASTMSDLSKGVHPKEACYPRFSGS